MPRSRREQKVSLTKTSKKGRELKQGIVSEVRKCVDDYSSVYVFSFLNMRSKLLKEVRMDFRKDSRFFMGKNKVMVLALGKSEADEYQDSLREVSKMLRGQVRAVDKIVRHSVESIAMFQRCLTALFCSLWPSLPSVDNDLVDSVNRGDKFTTICALVSS